MAYRALTVPAPGGSCTQAGHRLIAVMRRRDVLLAGMGIFAGGCAASSPQPDASGTISPAATGRTDVPEPASAPVPTASPAGRVVPLAGAPEGLAVDVADGVVAVGVRGPDGVALVDLTTGKVRRLVSLPGAPRHLGLAGPRGPLLVPAEQVDTLYQVSLPDGEMLTTTRVGHQPHDAAAAGSTIFVGNEYSNTVSVIRAGKQVATLPGPLQPGGVAASSDGAVVVVVGVRGRQISAYTAAGDRLGSAPCGVGPTHVLAGAGRLFYVADTEGDAVLVFQVDAHGPQQVGRVATSGGAPYGLALDAQRSLLYVTLTAVNLLQSFRITGQTLTTYRTWPTVRQPNSVAVDETTGQAIVTGTVGNKLQFIDTVAAG